MESQTARAQNSRMVRKRILIVDDNPIVRRMLVFMFVGHAYLGVCAEASDGQEAVAMAEECHPDLIIMDLAMPLMNGLDAAARIREFLNVPIILFSQHAQGLNALPRFRGITRIVSKDQRTLVQNAEELVKV
jgi:CheY-like chemotaxis protein